MQSNLNQTCVLIIDGCAVKTVDDFLHFKKSLPMFSKYKFLPPIEIELPPSWCTDDYGKYKYEFLNFILKKIYLFFYFVIFCFAHNDNDKKYYDWQIIGPKS